MPEKSSPVAFHTLLKSALRSRCASRKAAILFTGGLDSTALAVLARNCQPSLFFAAVDDPACANYNRSSISACKTIAAALGLSFHVVPVRKKDYLRNLLLLTQASRRPIKDLDLPAVMCLLTAIKRNGINTVISGMGADEIFRLPSATLKRFLEQQAPDTLADHQEIARRNKMIFFCPFLSRAVTRHALTTPLAQRKHKQPLIKIVGDVLGTGRPAPKHLAAHSFIPADFLKPAKLLIRARLSGK